ncbi:hypothetical protein FBEOM_6688 [Fusarium beomiforme]|uniref:Uncharacterized protein n=1 Tax=Fusarium beomiforme TaxID=44412 RepID=A0A9P5DYU3_9HYPO|nr:hypothetical protein FBEOM_6688 [Fusarium beomiforme]
MGSQKLTYEIDEKGKYTSRRTLDLAYLPEACRLKSVAIHLPESSKEYMRRKHEAPHIVEFLAEKTKGQPNFRRFRALRNLQGVDYLYCLRGIQELTFWDYDKWRTYGTKMPVRDWTFVRDINEVVRREKTADDEHFSQLRYLAPVMEGCRPGANLAARLEAILSPEPQDLGLLSPPPDGEILYPQPQAAVSQTIDSDDDSNDGSDDDSGNNDGDTESGDDMGDDKDDDGGDGTAGANHSLINDAEDDDDDDDEHGHQAHDDEELELLGAQLAHALPGYISAEDSDQEENPDPDAVDEVWADNGQTIDLVSDDEGNYGLQQERDRSRSLFLRSPTRAQQDEFVTKIETPSPPRTTPSAIPNRLRSSSSAIQAGVTPTRETRAESSLFVSPPSWEDRNPQTGDRSSPIGLTQQMELSFSSPASYSHSSSGSQSSGSPKRERSVASMDDDEENDGDDEDEDDEVTFMGTSPKRPRSFDEDDENDEIQLMRGPSKRPRLLDDDGGAEMVMEEELEFA